MNSYIIPISFLVLIFAYQESFCYDIGVESIISENSHSNPFDNKLSEKEKLVNCTFIDYIMKSFFSFLSAANTMQRSISGEDIKNDHLIESPGMLNRIHSKHPFEQNTAKELKKVPALHEMLQIWIKDEEEIENERDIFSLNERFVPFGSFIQDSLPLLNNFQSNEMIPEDGIDEGKQVFRRAKPKIDKRESITENPSKKIGFLFNVFSSSDPKTNRLKRSKNFKHSFPINTESKWNGNAINLHKRNAEMEKTPKSNTHSTATLKSSNLISKIMGKFAHFFQKREASASASTRKKVAKKLHEKTTMNHKPEKDENFSKGNDTSKPIPLKSLNGTGEEKLQTETSLSTAKENYDTKSGNLKHTSENDIDKIENTKTELHTYENKSNSTEPVIAEKLEDFTIANEQKSEVNSTENVSEELNTIIPNDTSVSKNPTKEIEEISTEIPQNSPISKEKITTKASISEKFSLKSTKSFTKKTEGKWKGHI